MWVERKRASDLFDGHLEPIVGINALPKIVRDEVRAGAVGAVYDRASNS
jgi:hypothetical protein